MKCSVASTLSICAIKGIIYQFLVLCCSRGVGFDLTLLSINNVSGLTSPSTIIIKDFGNGYFRSTITHNSISSFEVYPLQDFTGFIYQGSSANNFYIWGAQLEAQSYPTSYIPTAGTTVTRTQAVCTHTGSLASINTEEVFYIDST